MQDLHEAYPQEEWDKDNGPECFSGGDYEPLLKSFGWPIIVQTDDHDCQGDSRVLFHNADTNQYGVLIFGWGSCSGCDALQDCDTYDEVEQLRQRLLGDIQWRSASATLQWVTEHDWEGDYSNGPETQQFVAEVKAYLAAKL